MIFVPSLVLALISTALVVHAEPFRTKSGIRIDKAQYPEKLGHLQPEHLLSSIFEYDASSNRLISHNEVIQLPPHTSKVSAESAGIPTTRNGVRQRLRRTITVTSRDAHGRTFLFASDDNSKLLAAWGGGLQLHRLDYSSTHEIFFNSIPPSISQSSISTLTSSSRVSETGEIATATTELCLRKVYVFEMGLAYDASFCNLHGGNFESADAHMRALITELFPIFRHTVCVALRIAYIDSYCRIRSNSPSKPKFVPPLDLNQTLSGRDRSAIMLALVAREWNRTPSGGAHRDAAFLFSGFIDDSSLAGATYRAQVCNERLSFAWIERSIPAVLAHEVGHMLSARHAETGMMRSVVQVGENLVLSRVSQLEITRFIEKDSRSWCLKREGVVFGQLQRRHNWNFVGSFIFDKKFVGQVNVSDISYGRMNNDGVNDDIVTLVTERLAGGGVKMTYRVGYNVTCQPTDLCGLTDASKTVSNTIRPIEIPASVSKIRPGAFAFGFAIGAVRSAASRDVIMSYATPLRLQGDKVVTRSYYHVGLDFGDLIEPSEWSPAVRIPVFAENLQCASVSLGSLTAGSTDLVYVQVDRKKWRNVLSYSIGTELSPGGKPKRWTGAVEVPGWYGKKTTSVSAALLDVDGNGKVDLVLYHVDDTPTFKTGYVRVGRDLDLQTGRVTNGWTDFTRTASLFFTVATVRRAGALAVSTDVKNSQGNPLIATVDHGVTFIGSEAWKLYFASRVLTPQFMATSRERPSAEDISDGCNECYSPDEADQCRKDLNRCQSSIEMVRVGSAGNKESKPSLDRVAVRDLETYEDDDEVDNALLYSPNRPKKPSKDSIYCAGFHFLYTFRGGCDVIDRYTVLSKGLEVLFVDEVTNGPDAVPPEDVVESKSMFEDPSGVYGNGEPIVVQAKILNKGNDRYRQAIENAFMQLSKRVDFAAFVNPHKTIGRSVTKSKDGKRYIVKFFFNEKVLNDVY